MSLLGWILLGLMAGFMASNIVRSSGQGLLLDLVLGVIGAVVSGYLFTAIGATGPTGVSTVCSWPSLARSSCFGSTTHAAVRFDLET